VSDANDEVTKAQTAGRPVHGEIIIEWTDSAGRGDDPREEPALTWNVQSHGRGLQDPVVVNLLTTIAEKLAEDVDPEWPVELGSNAP
jgi:hypothetical protein